MNDVSIRRIYYITGTRADFGLMRSTLEQINAHPRLELGLVVTGMHLDPYYGNTVLEVHESGLPVIANIPVTLRSDASGNMARAIGNELLAMVDVLEAHSPDFLLLLGDRGEMLAGAIAALHLNIPIVHLHGGERSGTVDEPVRHAISKLAHIHFTSTKGARDRLIRMGERADMIYVTGAPGLDGLRSIPVPARKELYSAMGFSPDKRVALVVFHPVVQQSREAAAQIRVVLDTLAQVENLQVLVLMPNADAGGEAMREVINEPRDDFKVVNHLPRQQFCQWMATVDVMVGNSSSGIIEAASFNTPVVNIGSRQQGRERSANVRDVPVEAEAIGQAVADALAGGRVPVENIYGDGDAGERIVALLESIQIDSDMLLKCNEY